MAGVLLGFVMDVVFILWERGRVWNFGGEMVYWMRRVGGDVFLMMC